MIAKEVTDKVAVIVRDMLEERFEDVKDEVWFDQIMVEPMIDEYDDEYLYIRIIFEGDLDKVDSEWTVGMSGLLRPSLRELGVDCIASKTFIEKCEWDEFCEGQRTGKYSESERLY